MGDVNVGFASSTTTAFNPYKFSAYRNAAANSGNGAFALVTFDTILFDTNNNYSTSTGLYTAPIAGFYQFSWGVSCNTATNNLFTSLFKNGSDFIRGSDVVIASTTSNLSVGSVLMQLVATDTASIEVFCDATRALQVGVSPIFTYFSGYLVSRA